MKLIPMTDFVLSQYVATEPDEYKKVLLDIVVYAKFLSQPLALWMFVPCDENGNVLTEPDFWTWFVNGYSMPSEQDSINCNEYNKAKERVLFEEFEVHDVFTGVNEKTKTISLGGLINVFWFDTVTQTWNPSIGVKNIEGLVNYGLTLTETALKTL